MKVLIVDDSPDTIVIAEARLRKDGLEVVSAPDGGTALLLAGTEKPDLILLDVDMPDMTGFEVCRFLKADPKLSHIPVIFLTAMDDVEQKVHGLDLGAVDYVTKPFDSFELRARVQAALRTKRMADMLIKHAQIDPLTELPNRRALTDHLHREWARQDRHGGKFSLVMIDVDHFKRVNDTYGHNVGDRVLKAIATAIGRQCRQDDLAARYGGEEFTLLAVNQDAAAASILAERCRQSVEDTSVRAGDKAIGATISCGVADSSEVGSITNLIELADRRLYQAKQAGRNQVKAPPCQADITARAVS